VGAEVSDQVVPGMFVERHDDGGATLRVRYGPGAVIAYRLTSDEARALAAALMPPHRSSVQALLDEPEES
jgi:hypothetical protein